MPSYKPYKGPGGRLLAYFKFRRKTYSKVVATKADGRAWHREMEAELKRLAVTNQTSTYSGICKEYLEDCSARMRANTVQEKFAHYSHFAQYIRKDVAAATITLDHAKAFIRAIQGSKGNKVANRYLRNLKALWNWHRDKIFTNPWASVRAYPEEGYVKYVPPQEDVAAVLLAASPWEQEFLNVILKTGARLGEVMKLRWEDVNFERGFDLPASFRTS